MSDAKPYTLGELPADWKNDCRVKADRFRATVEALEEARAHSPRGFVCKEMFEQCRRERDEARACIADALSVVLDPATSGEHWSILPSVVENLRDERDKWKAALNDALEQLRHEEHLRTTAERERDEVRGDADTYGETLAYLTEVGARGHDVQGDAIQGVASLVEQRDSLREVLTEVRAWRRFGVGLEPQPKTDTETLGQRIDTALKEPK